jgi:hypothetical protein
MPSDRDHIRDSLATAMASLTHARTVADRLARESFYRDIPGCYPHRWSNAVLLSHDIALLLDQLHRLIGPPHHLGPVQSEPAGLADGPGSRLPALQQQPIPGAGVPHQVPSRSRAADAAPAAAADAAHPDLHPAADRSACLEVGG